MRILGIDPGSTRIGMGLIHIERSRYHVLSYGLLIPEKDLIPLPLDKKLVMIYDATLTLLEKTTPDIIGMENLVFGKNTKTVFSVAYARGIILLAASKKNIPIFEPNPSQVKQGVTTQGNAHKKQVAYMVKTILNIPQETKILDDITDALAIAITTANFRNQITHS